MAPRKKDTPPPKSSKPRVYRKIPVKIDPDPPLLPPPEKPKRGYTRKAPTLQENVKVLKQAHKEKQPVKQKITPHAERLLPAELRLLRPRLDTMMNDLSGMEQTLRTLYGPRIALKSPEALEEFQSCVGLMAVALMRVKRLDDSLENLFNTWLDSLNSHRVQATTSAHRKAK